MTMRSSLFTTSRRRSDRDQERASLPPWNLKTLLNAGDFLETADVSLVLQDNDAVVRDCNITAARLFGVTDHLLIGRTLLDPEWGVVQVDGSPFPQAGRPEMVTIREGTVTNGTVVGFDVVAKARTWLSVNTCPAQVGGATVGVISSFVDITTQIQRERTMGLMHAVNRFAMSTTNETKLLQHLCDEIVTSGDYSLAWIAEASETERGVVDICFSAGTTAYLYDDIVTSLSSQTSGLDQRASPCELVQPRSRTTSRTSGTTSNGARAPLSSDSRRASPYRFISVVEWRCSPFTTGTRSPSTTSRPEVSRRLRARSKTASPTSTRSSKSKRRSTKRRP